ncbi:protease modulator HflC [Malikia spinosa]|jgi:membrane protease subunit HflC|uniref:Protein HflC n=1 Tax=Malikia spinosa TaxID=86180 RepID=A0A2S9KJG7_9BURK|nr:protease modulator HflC [Malikia spinosa]MYZ53963.1 protease modulator HflC [Malikia spinosa]OGB70872.1 MAG: HflC protein [Burkholderiales bacterium RIFOXYC12_FULL_65_23]PRD70564.1 protease modulator HflC [Malikia spinosa]
MNRIGFILSSLLVALALASSMLFVVDQRQFGVVYALGQIKSVITEPGLHVKLPPPFQNVSYVDKRLLTLKSSDTEPTLTAEKQRVVIDWYVRWRISDPQAYIRNVGLDERAGTDQLKRVVRNSFQQEVNKRTVKELLSSQREQLMADVKREVLAAVRGADKPWGMDVVDVRITRVDYAETITKSVYDRMEAERKRVANELRSTGSADGEKIRADADRQREVLVAQAFRDAQKIKGEGDAEASRIYAQSFGKDPAFAQFYRSLEAYKSSFANKSDMLVLDPSSEFFKAMRSSGSAAAAR